MMPPELENKSRPPPPLHFDSTGEKFEFKTSAKSADGAFRFRWTLAAGSKGPPEHLHDDESETFEVVSGALRIWLDGVPQELAVGERLVVSTGVRHRFLNPTKEPVVVEVSLDGPRMEDCLVPLAYHFDGREKMSLGDMSRMLVHTAKVKPNRSPSRFAQAIFNGFARLMSVFGVKSLPLIEHWQEPST